MAWSGVASPSASSTWNAHSRVASIEVAILHTTKYSLRQTLRNGRPSEEPESPIIGINRRPSLEPTKGAALRRCWNEESIWIVQPRYPPEHLMVKEVAMTTGGSTAEWGEYMRNFRNLRAWSSMARVTLPLIAQPKS
jgi:hypothetical protein